MNWVKWSDIERVILPEIQLSTLFLMKILSMRVAIFSAILVDKVIWGIKLYDKRLSKNLLTPGDIECLSRLRLNSPVRIQFLFSCVSILRSSSMYLLSNLRCFIERSSLIVSFIRNHDFNENKFQFFWTVYLKVCSAFIW